MWVFETGGRIVQIAGNYDDYLLYRERRPEPSAAPEAATRPRADEPTASTAAVSVRRKLTWQESKELEKMEQRIHDAEERVADLEKLIHAPDFYQRPHEETRMVLDALNGARAEVEQLFQRWEELEAVRSGR
jgi:ATP-binding cassette subfamily F protein uup